MTSRAATKPLLQYKLFIRQRASATQGTPPGRDDLKWVANTTTLVCGERDALLVDTFLSDEQTAQLADWIAVSERRLSTIYITHGHPDHFFGLKLLRDRFPEARALATPQVVDAMQAALRPESVENWRRRFPGLIPESFALAENSIKQLSILKAMKSLPSILGTPIPITPPAFMCRRSLSLSRVTPSTTAPIPTSSSPTTRGWSPGSPPSIRSKR